MIPITPEQYLTTILNSYFKDRGRCYSVKMEVGSDFYTAYKAGLITLTREVPDSKRQIVEHQVFRTGVLIDSGKPGWDVRITREGV